MSIFAGCGMAAYDKPGLTWEEWKRDDTECRRAGATADAKPDPAAYGQCLRERGYRMRAE